MYHANVFINLQSRFSCLCLKVTVANFISPYESPGDLTKDDIADDLERSLKVISGTINGFIICITQKCSIHNVRSQLQRLAPHM